MARLWMICQPKKRLILKVRLWINSNKEFLIEVTLSTRDWKMKDKSSKNYNKNLIVKQKVFLKKNKRDKKKKLS